MGKEQLKAGAEMDLRDAVAFGGTQRIFRARNKLNEPGFISHITQRAAGKEPLFLEESDYLLMLALLKEASEMFGISFYAFCLMPNHVHLLIKPGERNLPEAMRSIFYKYARRFNAKYQRRGHLFCGPYRQAVCLDTSYLLTASVYIHLNPVRGGLVEKAGDYRWSTCRLYCFDQGRNSFVDPNPILHLVNEDNEVAREQYRSLVQHGKEVRIDEAMEQEGAIERFCLKLSRLFPALFKGLGNQGNSFSTLDKKQPEMFQLEELLNELKRNGSKAPETIEARRFLIEQLLARGYKKTQIAESLGLSRKTIYNILNAS